MVKERSEIEDEYKWDLESVYEDEEEWEEDFDEAQELIGGVQKYEGEVTESPDKLLEALKVDEKLERKIKKLNIYALCKSSEDTRESKYQGLRSRLYTLAAKASEATNFIFNEIRDAGEETVMGYLDENEELSTYRHTFEDIFRMEEHRLSDEKRELISQITDVLGVEKETRNLLMNSDIEFPTVDAASEYNRSTIARDIRDMLSGLGLIEKDKVTVTHSNRSKLLKERNREFRKNVYMEYMETVTQQHSTLAKNYENKVKRNAKMAEIRGYDSARHKAMKGIDVPVELYDLLIEIVEDNLDPLHRKSKIRKEVMGLDQIMPWDGRVPLLESDEPELSFEEAKDHILNAFSLLGDEYVQKLEEGLESGWVDVYPNKGKESGAFSIRTYDTKPFILMNFEQQLSDMYTLAHEGGHSMHKKLTNNEQPHTYSEHPTFTAEIASTVNETLLTRHLLENVDDEEFRKHVLTKQISRIQSTIFTQTRFATFEDEAHRMVEEDKPLTAEVLDDLYSDISDKYSSEHSGSTRFKGKGWMQISHFFRPFYVYQYATGMSAAIEIADQIMEEGEPAAERYREFLKSGARKYPLELLDDLGIDMESGEPIEKAMETYEELVDELEELVI